MTGALLLFAAWWVPVFALALALQLSGKLKVGWSWMGLAAAIYAIYGVAWHIALPENVLSLPPESRWLSRVASLGVGLGALVLIWRRARSLHPVPMGLTHKQAPGSLKYSIAAVILLALLGTVPGGFTPGGEVPAAHAIAYHLTLPGVEEEIIYRAVLMGLFMAALGESRSALIWAAVMSWIVFTMAHAVVLVDGQIRFNGLAFLAYVGFAGAVLVWVRIKSGSILMPAIAHNLIGLAGRFA